ncbi:MAG TPA: alcohol dehydrogenase catalytic domain-containing protein [Blastocatellia bacterium]|nr:alcohol dehydrogenase catalytic domain-containing protein [Blastocatellia bacterium]
MTDVATLEVREVPRPEIGPHDVLVRVSSVGLCGTDFHIFEGHANYNTDGQGRLLALVDHPQILGHEIAGVIEETGREVGDLRAGDRVVLDQGLNCLSERRAQLCEYCSSGDSHQCESYREHGITGLQGGLADYIAIPAVNAVRISSDLDSGEAALAEPVGCIVHSSDAASRACGRYAINHADADRRVRAALICGAGPAGLLFAQYLRNVLGYDELLIVAEPNVRKRALAASFGASVIDPNAADLVATVQEMTDGRRVEYLIEATGAGLVFAQIPGLIRKQATVLLYGHGHYGVDLGVMNNVQFMEPTLVSPVGASGGFEPDGRPSTYRRALRLIEEGLIRVAPFITHRYSSLESATEVFAGDHRALNYVKGVVMLGA